jgi:hypothetical protein
MCENTLSEEIVLIGRSEKTRQLFAPESVKKKVNCILHTFKHIRRAAWRSWGKCLKPC